jgi:cysteine-rich repeat protein
MPKRLRFAVFCLLAAATAWPNLADARQLTVRWTSNDASATGFRLYLRAGTAAYGTPAYDGLPTPQSGVYQVQIAASDTDTVYVMGRSYNASGESSNSNELTFTPPAPTPICGNGVVEAGEQCDDGNTTTEACAYGQASCTVCNATCQRVAGATSFCGDGVVDAAHGEACDDGNGLSGDGCSATCQVETPAPVCGNGVVEAGEQCDDGNTITEACAYGQASCMVCGAACQRVAGATSFCGDGVVDAAHGEACDDGNQVSGDGCSATCQVEVKAPVCGNGVVEAGEQCDDGGTTTEACAYGQASCTVCNATCQRVAGATSFCGDGVVDAAYETCDDGNVTPGDGCSATCQLEATPVCGNGVVELGEQCDDGNTTPGDGCDAACMKETERVTLPYYVDAGGTGLVDPVGHTWIGDAPYANGGRTATTSAYISKTVLDAVFSSRRYGPTTGVPLTYELPVNGFGSYAVRLDFAELDPQITKAGQRVFDVEIEGSFVLPNIDVFAAVGARTAYTRDFTVNVSDGSLTIRLLPKIGEPMIAGIEVSDGTLSAATPRSPSFCNAKGKCH